MPLDGITTLFLTKELNEILSGGRIERIHQPAHKDILLKIRSSRRSYYLKISANPSEPIITFADAGSQNPASPPRFCSILRKHLSGAKIDSITCPAGERIITISLSTINEIGDKSQLSLICELMGRHSNIILTDPDMTIIDAMIHVDSRTSTIREVLPAHPYHLPPEQDKLDMDTAVEQIGSKCFFDRESGILPEKYIVNYMKGFSPLIAKEIVNSAYIPAKLRISLLDDDQISSLSLSFLNVITQIKENDIRPCVLFKDISFEIPLDFHALQIKSMPYVKYHDTVSDAIRTYHTLKNTRISIENKKVKYLRAINKKIKSISTKANIHTKELADSQDHKKYRKYGDLIYSNLYRIEDKATSFEAIDYESADMPLIRIKLDPNMSPSENAQRFYKRFKKLKSKFENAHRFLNKELEDLIYLDSVAVSIGNSHSEEDLAALEEEFSNVPILKDISKGKTGKTADKIRKPVSKTRKYLSSDGYEILIGRNNLQNDKITFSLSSKNDIWMHIQKYPGAHTLIKRDSSNKDIPETTIEEAAMLTAWHSRSDGSKNAKAIIDYCEVQFVTRQKKSSPGRVLYREFSSITVDPCIPDGVTVIDS